MKDYITLIYAEAETGELLLAEAPECTVLNKGDLVMVDGYDDLCVVIKSVYMIRKDCEEFEMITTVAGEIQGRVLAKYKRVEMLWGDDND